MIVKIYNFRYIIEYLDVPCDAQGNYTMNGHKIQDFGAGIYLAWSEVEEK